MKTESAVALLVALHAAAAGAIFSPETPAIRRTIASASAERQIFDADPTRTPDLFLQSTFDYGAQGKLLSELRAALKSATGFDPLSHRLDKSIPIQAKIGSKMNALVKEMVQKLLGFDFQMGEVLIDVEGLHYETPEASLNLDSVTKREDGLDIPLSLRLRRTKITADRILIHFRSNATKPSFLDKFFIEFSGTTLSAESLDSLSVDLTVHAHANADGSIKLTLPKNTFSVFDRISAETLQKELVLTPGEIRLPEMSLNIGRNSRPLDVEGMKAVIETRKVHLANLVFDPLVQEIKKVPANLLKNQKDSLTIPSQIEFDVPCIGKTAVRLLQYGQIGPTQLFLGLGIVRSDYRPPAESAENFAQAGDILEEKISSGKFSAAFGIRDQFLAWAIQKGVETCAKDKIPAALALGPAGVHARMGSGDGEDGALGIHAMVTVQGKLKAFLARLLLGRSSFGFPIKIAPKLNFRSGGAEPAKLALNLSEADLSDETLMNGFDGIPSNVMELRFKKKVKAKIRGELQEALGKAKIEIPLGFLQNPDVSFADIESDRLGHLDLLLSLDPTLHPSAASFWSNLAPYLKKAIVSKNALGPTVGPQP
ncbi:MAG: hypothetical protein JST04_02775 [Bdellovibrionales bacterium]|nr:hypothetical protein [Bdellovibrionales bacterium]